MRDYQDDSHFQEPVEWLGSTAQGFKQKVFDALDRIDTVGNSLAINPERDALQALLKDWHQSGNGRVRSPTHLIHLLDRHYKGAELDMHSLLGKDLEQIKALDHISRIVPIKIFLAQLEVTELRQRGVDRNEWAMEERDEDDSEDGYSSHDEPVSESPIETSCRIVCMKDIAGEGPAIRNLAFSQGNILQYESITDGEGEEQEPAEYGDDAFTTVYHRTAVFIIPEDAIEMFLIKSNQDFASEKHVQYWTGRCSTKPEDVSAYQAMVRCCKVIWGRPAVPWSGMPDAQLSEIRMASVLDTALLHKDFAFFEHAATKHQNQLSHMWFHSLRVDVDRHSDPEARFAQVRQGLTNAVLAFTSADRMFDALKTFSGAQDSVLSNPQAETSKWAQSTALTIVERLPALATDASCADSVLNIIDYLNDPLVCISAELFPAVEKAGSTPRLCINMLSALRKRARGSASKSADYKRLYRQLALKFLTSCKLEELLSLKPTAPVAGMPVLGPRDRYLTHDQFLAFLADSIEMSAGDSKGFLEEVWTRLFIVDYARISALDVQCSWVPLLQGLVVLLPKAGYELTDPLCRELYHSLLDVYVEKYVGQPPNEARSYVRNGVNCPCQDCRVVNAFLGDGNQTHILMAINLQRRQHVLRILDSAGVDYTSQVIKDRSPHRLNIVKSFSKVLSAQRSWEARGDDAKRKMDRIPSLQTVLAGDYDSLMARLGIQTRTGLAERRDGGNVGVKRERESGGPSAGPKRSRIRDDDVIDLTQD
ncbi:hypothetical protein LIA77_05979 [Sarocladium implicatum]|nr:hypothetical protein LIA77_05979 [Sarocladium implicatum]